MKKIILGFFISLLIFIPSLSLSASNLTDKLKGKILLAVEDHGKTYYVHEDGARYRVTTATAQKIFEKLALGITNENLEKIPLNDVGIEPEVKVSNNQTETTNQTKIIYVEKQQSCDYSSYTKQISQLQKELSEIKKLQNSNTKTEENLIRTDYELKINNLKLEIIEISILKDIRYYDLRDMFYNSNGIYCAENPSPIDTNFKQEILKKMFSKVSETSIHQETEAVNFFNTEINNRDIQIALLQNEMERVILNL